MSDKTQALDGSGKWLLLGLLALAACGVAPEALEAPGEEVQAGSVSAMHNKPSPDPTLSTPTFATGTAVATDGNQSLVVWRDVLRPGEMFAARVSKNGKLLDPESLRLNPGAVTPGSPAVAFDGRQFLAVWQGEHSLFLARVRPDGTVAGAPRVLASIGADPSSAPGIACTWRTCLVAWSDFGDPRRVRGVLVRALDTGVSTRELTIATVPARARRMKSDPLRGVLEDRPDVAAALARLAAAEG